MSELCFWILTDGTIVQPDSRHILCVVDSPTAFGETETSLQDTFEQYGQGVKSNFEGEARKEVLIRVIQRNHIRIRKNQYKRNQHWSIQLYELNDERKRTLSTWAKHTVLLGDKFADVIIHQFCDGSESRTSLNLLANGCDGDEDFRIVSQTELSRRYKRIAKL